MYNVTLTKHCDVAHGIGDISMRFFIFIEVRPIIYQKFQNFANINNLTLKYFKIR